MKTKTSSLISRENRWEKSRRAERRGDFAKAFKIHQTILAEETTSYAAAMRAGWLCYKLEDYEAALRFYEQAGVISNDAWPLDGIMNCLTALGESDTLAKVAESIYGTGKRAIRSAAA